MSASSKETVQMKQLSKCCQIDPKIFHQEEGNVVSGKLQGLHLVRLLNGVQVLKSTKELPNWAGTAATGGVEAGAEASYYDRILDDPEVKEVVPAFVMITSHTQVL